MRVDVGTDAQPGHAWLSKGDADWPSRVDDLSKAREDWAVRRLWIEGRLPTLPAVAVVGARRATAVGLEVARRIGAELARHDLAVVSGFALGVDAAAHRGCLAVGGSTVAILGCGLDVDYPPQHRGLRAEIAAHGALITEYERGQLPENWRFPRRNRVIAALAHAVIVVEAGVSSGALSTARWALELGRDVLAVPGSTLGPTNVGSNLLLRDGARPYLDASDLSDTFPHVTARLPGLSTDADSDSRNAGDDDIPADGKPTSLNPIPPGPTARLLALLGPEAMPRELLSRALDLTASELAVLLGELELSGAIHCLPGGLVTRIGLA